MSLKVTSIASIKGNQASINQEVIFESSEDLLKGLYKDLEIDYPKFYKMDELSKLGFLAVEMIMSKRPDLKEIKDDEVGLVFQSENGCLKTDVQHQNDVNAEKASPAVFVYTLSNIVCGEISIRNKWYGESAFFIEDSSKLENLITYSESLILTGKAKMCFVGVIEAYGNDLKADVFVIESTDEGEDLSAADLQRIIEG